MITRMSYSEILEIDADTYDRVEEWLNHDGPVIGYNSDVLFEDSVSFPNDYSVDVKVVNSESGAWLEFVLFQNGIEKACSEPAFSLSGDTTLSISDQGIELDFTVFVERVENT